MITINTLVYKSREDKKYVAEGYEISHIGIGDNREEAIKDYLRALKTVKNIVTEGEKKGERIELLSANTCSKRCKEGLQRIILNENNINPEIKFVGNLEIHFYKEIRK